MCGRESQSGADLVDGGDDARGVTGPPRDDFVVHLESGDLADGAEHLEDAEAFPRPMLYVALGAPAWRARPARPSARSPALCGLISETVGVRTYVLAMEIVGVQRLREWSLLDAGGCSDQDLVNAVAAVMQAEEVLAGVRLRLLAEVDARELAEVLGTASTAAWLTSSGRVGAGVARRMVATAQALVELPHTAHELSVGEISEAHATAVVGAMGAIDGACPGLPAEGRVRAEARLVDTAMSDTPAAVGRCGQELLLALAPPEMDATAAEDATRNRLDLGRTRNGRTLLRGDFDKETAEKLHTALSPLTNPPPRRTAPRRRVHRHPRRLPGVGGLPDRGWGHTPPDAQRDGPRPRRTHRHRTNRP